MLIIILAYFENLKLTDKK